MLLGKKILIGISASISAYKTISLVRLLIKEQAEVKIVLTPSSVDFVSPLVLSTLSKNEVLINFSTNNNWNNHVELGLWADYFIIVPLGANTLAKMSNGICDNMLLGTYLSARCPVAVAPAMDDDMYKHATTQKNLATLQAHGVKIIPVGYGELASGLIGEGRMAEPLEILEFIKKEIIPTPINKSIQGKKILISVGATIEYIDPVRFISNASSGKMGVSIANAFSKMGAQVTLIVGLIDTNLTIDKNIKIIHAENADSMFENCMQIFPTQDICIMSAAISDYKIKNYSANKIKKTETDILNLELVKTKDVLKALGTIKKTNQKLIGFALETENGKANALKKIQTKNCDIIILNMQDDSNKVLGTNSNKVSIIKKDNIIIEIPTNSKEKIALEIIHHILEA